MTNSAKKKFIKAVIVRVNATLGYFELGYVSAKRLPELEQTRCTSFQEFLEIRFNFEAYKIPELQKLLEETEGRLFTCVELEGEDLTKNRYTLATFKLIDVEMLPEGLENLKDEIQQVRELLGWSQISFNSVKKKIKIIIKNE